MTKPDRAGYQITSGSDYGVCVQTKTTGYVGPIPTIAADHKGQLIMKVVIICTLCDALLGLLAYAILHLIFGGE